MSGFWDNVHTLAMAAGVVVLTLTYPVDAPILYLLLAILAWVLAYLVFVRLLPPGYSP